MANPNNVHPVDQFNVGLFGRAPAGLPIPSGSRFTPNALPVNHFGGPVNKTQPVNNVPAMAKHSVPVDAERGFDPKNDGDQYLFSMREADTSRDPYQNEVRLVSWRVANRALYDAAANFWREQTVTLTDPSNAARIQCLSDPKLAYEYFTDWLVQKGDDATEQIRTRLFEQSAALLMTYGVAKRIEKYDGFSSYVLVNVATKEGFEHCVNLWDAGALAVSRSLWFIIKFVWEINKYPSYRILPFVHRTQSPFYGCDIDLRGRRLPLDAWSDIDPLRRRWLATYAECKSDNDETKKGLRARAYYKFCEYILNQRQRLLGQNDEVIRALETIRRQRPAGGDVGAALVNLSTIADNIGQSKSDLASGAANNWDNYVARVEAIVDSLTNFACVTMPAFENAVQQLKVGADQNTKQLEGALATLKGNHGRNPANAAAVDAALEAIRQPLQDALDNHCLQSTADAASLASLNAYFASIFPQGRIGSAQIVPQLICDMWADTAPTIDLVNGLQCTEMLEEAFTANHPTVDEETKKRVTFAVLYPQAKTWILNVKKNNVPPEYVTRLAGAVFGEDYTKDVELMSNKIILQLPYKVMAAGRVASLADPYDREAYNTNGPRNYTGELGDEVRERQCVFGNDLYSSELDSSSVGKIRISIGD